MKGLHEWHPKQAYTGDYINPKTGEKCLTFLHDVQCSECHLVVTLPFNVMPEELEGCLGTAARPPQKKKEFEDKHGGADKDAVYDSDAGSGKVRQIRR